MSCIVTQLDLSESIFDLLSNKQSKKSLVQDPLQDANHLYGGMPLEPLALSVDSSICGSFLVADCPYFHIPSQLSSAKK